jgi:hypothetical protein
MPLLISSAFAAPVELVWHPGFKGGRAIEAGENAFVQWDITSADKEQPQIEVFDRTGNRTHLIGVLRSVQQAESVGIGDVSVDDAGNVAVAAVFAKPGRLHEPVLLLYDRWGRLQNAVGLAEGRAIARLELDQDGSIWALGQGSDDLDPKDVPILFHYDAQGREIGSFVSRSQFPEDAEFTEEGPGAGGAPSLGITEELVWFWLPASRRLATLRKDGSNLAIYTTGFPGLGGSAESGERRTEVKRVAFLSSGELLADATVFGSLAVLDSGLFRWTLSEGWRKIDSPRVPLGARLLNVKRSGDLVLQQVSSTSDGLSVSVATLD